MKNLANILTITRLLVLPFMVALFYVDQHWASWACLGLYVIGAVTDFLDGWVARKFNQITEFGRFLDPIADKIFVLAVMIMLIATDIVTGYGVILILLILMREFLVSGIREFLGPRDIKMPVTNLAKWKTAAQMLALAFLIVSMHHVIILQIGIVLLAIATLLTLVTGFGYLKASWQHIKA